MARMMLDRIGWIYMSLFIAWNIVLFAGMVFLWIHRLDPSLRMRRLPLLLAGVFSLHVYAALCIIAYPIGPSISCTLEFWVMSIWLPFGIALFHAANSQFLHLASRQKQFVRMSALKEHRSIDEEKAQAIANSRWRRMLAGLERADNINRTLICIGIGMATQFLLTLFVFFGSKKFHASYGLFDYTFKGTGMESRMQCSKGWEWWLSIVWQFFWAWLYAPYLLWKSRSIRDVHGWRLQTVCCCLAGLPATPLWLVSMYTPQFSSLNAVLPPPTWFSVCIFFMELFAVGFPIIGVIKGNALRQETLEAIADWEMRQTVNGLNVVDGSLKSPSGWSYTTTLKSASDLTVVSKGSLESNRSAMLTMTALENALRSNALPLLEFAALKDFSGENVSFLTHVADWRRYWFSLDASAVEHRRKQFIAATHIYAHFISLEFSDFPINISSREMKLLHHIFEGAARLLYGDQCRSISSATSENATPFDNVLPDEVTKTPTCKDSHSSTLETGLSINLDSLGRANFQAALHIHDLHMDAVLASIEIPETFTEMVFDAAESEIKYLVLTNTWPKFVNAGCANSQISRKSDEEKGNRWINNVLRSS